MTAGISGDLASRADAALTIQEIFLRVEEPSLNAGQAIVPPNDGVLIQGWVLGVRVIEEVSVCVDGKVVGTAHLGIRREDVGAAFPNRPGALLSGFAFVLSPRLLGHGLHTIEVTARDSSSFRKSLRFEFDVRNEDPDRAWWAPRGSATTRQVHTSQADAPKAAPITILLWLGCPGEPVDPALVAKTLTAVTRQTSRSWRLLIAPSTPLAQVVSEVIAPLDPVLKSRVLWMPEQARSGLLMEGSSDRDVWLWPLHVRDVLSADAVADVCAAVERDPSSELIYADERCLNIVSGRVQAFSKPDWSPELLLATNYLGHAWCVRLDLLRRSGSALRDAELANLYHLALTCTEHADRIVHIPNVFCERAPDNDEASDAGAMAALRQVAARRKIEAEVVPGRVPHTFWFRPSRGSTERVSIVIPTCAALGLVERCLDSIKAISTHRNLEIICVENIVDSASLWKPWLRSHANVVVEVLETFNWSRFNNLGAAEASGSHLLFLNDDIEVIQPDWLEAMLGAASHPGVGVVGPQLIYPDGTVQHAGMVLSGRGAARHAFRYAPADDPGYFGLALTQRNVMSLTGACMLMRRDVFDRLGGFDEAHAIVNNDVDFCLRAYSSGLRSLYTPFAQLIHHELASRAQLEDLYDAPSFQQNWSALLDEGDPYSRAF